MGPCRLPERRRQRRPYADGLHPPHARGDKGRNDGLPARALPRGRGSRSADRSQAVHDALAVRAVRLGSQHPAARAGLRDDQERGQRPRRGAGADRPRVRDGQGLSRAAGCEGFHPTGSRRRAAALRLQHAAQRRRPPRSRRLESLADGSDGIRELRALYRRDLADALRLQHPHQVRPGRHRLRARRRARRGERGGRPHPDGRVRARSRLRRQDRPSVAHLRLGYPGIAGARLDGQPRVASHVDDQRRAAEEDLHRRDAQSRRRQRTRSRRGRRRRRQVRWADQLRGRQHDRSAARSHAEHRASDRRCLAAGRPAAAVDGLGARGEPRGPLDVERAPDVRPDATARHLGAAHGTCPAHQRHDWRRRRRRVGPRQRLRYCRC